MTLYNESCNKSENIKPKTGVGFIIKCLALFSLLCAYAAGQMIKNESLTDLIKRGFPGVIISRADWSPDAYSMHSLKNNASPGHLLIKKVNGWGGPALTAVQIDNQGEITRIAVLSHKETPSFFRIILASGFFSQFIGKKADEAFEPGQDINAVSGATVSSRAFTEAAKIGAHDFAVNYLQKDIPRQQTPWNIGINEYILIALYTIIVVSTLKNFLKIRKMVLAFSIIFLGFHMSSPLSISGFGSLFLGYLPPVKSHFFRWLLLTGTLLLVLIHGRNYYCLWMCPFGGIQKLIAKTAGFRIKIAGWMIKGAKYFALFLLWLSLMIIFLTSNPAFGMFEPFATFFSFKGDGIQWSIVSITIFASFLIPRFWCRFFCPVGAFLTQVLNLGKQIRKHFDRN